jgi:hypothetical protein
MGVKELLKENKTLRAENEQLVRINYKLSNKLLFLYLSETIFATSRSEFKTRTKIKTTFRTRKSKCISLFFLLIEFIFVWFIVAK